MSNPGVIVLASLRNAGPNIKRLDVEDNIGESIHIHLNSLRFDFSVDEFILFADQLFDSLLELQVFQKYSLKDLDPQFLFEISPLIPDLAGVEIQECRLSDLKCLSRFRLPKIGNHILPVKINKSSAYQYLKSNNNSFMHYVQENYPGLNNVKRLENLCISMEKNGYPYKSNYIVVFGDQNFIRDGQHRAAILASLGGINQQVKVMHMQFKGNRWRLKPYLQFPISLLKQFSTYGRTKIKRLIKKT